MVGLFVGIISGIIFFGGLYLTVQKLNTVKHPSILLLLSFVLRMAILLGGLYLVSKYGFVEMLLALLGIITVKLVMIIWAKRAQ
jgi:F1F0 ATPase subunit 2